MMYNEKIKLITINISTFGWKLIKDKEVNKMRKRSRAWRRATADCCGVGARARPSAG